MRKLGPVEHFPGVEYQSDEELVEAAGKIASSIFHPVGTMRMGTADSGAVCDAR